MKYNYLTELFYNIHSSVCLNDIRGLTRYTLTSRQFVMKQFLVVHTTFFKL